MERQSVTVSMEALTRRCAEGAAEPLSPPVYAWGELSARDVRTAVWALVSGERRWPEVHVLAVGASQAEVLYRWSVVPCSGSASGVVVDGALWLAAACLVYGVRPAWVEGQEWEEWGVPGLWEDGSLVWVGPGEAVPSGAVMLPAVMPARVALFERLPSTAAARTVAGLRARTVRLEVETGSVVEVLGRCLELAVEAAYEAFHA
jgi:hypothetical protein